MDRRPAHRRAARQDPGRLELDQRPHLQSRPAAGLRRLGAARQPRLGLCRRAALLPPERARGVGEADETFRGREGNLPITDLDWRDPLCEAFIEGAVQMGIPRNRDYNGTMQAGVSYVQRIIQNGRRISAARGYLHPAMKRQNLTVRTHAHATEIVLEGKRAVGVRYRKGGRDGTPMEVRAAKEVILCGGTVNSPQLLQVSGIGPAPLLQSLGIAVKHALPGVGENLRDHYAPRFVARVKNAETINETIARAQAGRRSAEIRRRPQGHPVAQSDADLRVLEVRRARRQLRPAAHLHAGQLQGRRAVDPRRFPRHDHRLLAAAARQHRLRARALGRSVRASRHPAQLSRGRKRPPACCWPA